MQRIMKRFPNWPKFSFKSHFSILSPLISGKVNYWTGKKGMEFEAAFQEKFNLKNAISCSSGTAALHTSLCALDIGPGDEVIVPSYSFIATSYSVLFTGAVPVFCDVTMDHTIDAEKIESLITKRTKAIILVHLYGVVCDMDKIKNIAEKHNLYIIEDAAQCIGGKYKDSYVGSLGHIAAFSFCQSKHFTTGGEGGMVTTSNEELAWKCRSIRDHGFDVKRKIKLLELERIETYVHNQIGFNYRMTEIQSIIGLNELKRFKKWNLYNRKENAKIYYNKFRDNSYIETLPYNSKERENSFWLFPITFKENISSELLVYIQEELERRNVPFMKVLWPEIYREKTFIELNGFGSDNFPFNSKEYTDISSIDYKNTNCPVAKYLAERTLNLFIHPTWNKKQINYCATELLDILEKIGEKK